MESKEVRIPLPENCEVGDVKATVEDNFIVVEYTPKEKEIIKTFKDLVRSKSLSGFWLEGCKVGFGEGNWLIQGGMFLKEKQARSAIAMARISQLMPYYGGEITDEEWRDAKKTKYLIGRLGDGLYTGDTTSLFHYFLAFHTLKQAEDFLENNRELCEDYYMLKTK